MAKRTTNNNRNNKRPNGNGNHDYGKKKFTSKRGDDGRADKSCDYANERKPKESKDGANDPAWYSKNAELVRDGANIIFGWATGLPIDMRNPVTDSKLNVPGLMSIELIPSIGWSDSPFSPAMVAANELFTKVRINKSGTQYYDKTDLFIMVAAVADVYSYINYLIRVYSAAMLYAQQNRYLPKAIIQASHVDFESLINNLANFRYGINVLITKAASLPVPATLPLFQRRTFIYQNVYIEGTSIKNQMYMYNPAGFMKYNQTDSATGGQLVYSPLSGGLNTIPQLLSYGETLLTPLLASQDVANMGADIRNSYGDNLIKLAPIGVDQILVPIFNIGVLEQMKNATIVLNSGLTPQNLNVTQHVEVGNSYLVYTPTLATNPNSPSVMVTALAKALTENRILTTGTEFVDTGLIMESTRLMTACELNANQPENQTVVNMYPGTEIAVRCECYTTNQNSSGSGFTKTSLFYNYYLDTSVPASAVLYGQWLNTLSSFRYHPYEHVFVDPTNPTSAGRSFDVDNFAILTSDQVRKLHEIAILSEFNVDATGRV